MRYFGYFLLSIFIATTSGISLYFAKDRGYFDFLSNKSVAPDDAKIVTVDVTRILNAQRRYVGTNLSEGLDRINSLSLPGRTASDAIQHVAGEGAVVLVKQAVVISPPGVPDITDRVLEYLQLDTSVPTIAPHKRLGAGFDTDYGLDSIVDKSEQHAADIQRRMIEAVSRDNWERTDELLP